ncbi:MAG TPA: hypothetical protein VF789_18420 [Thermoanaerobaculia bacterium]
MEYFMLNANATENELAEFLGIHVDTLRKYAKRFPSVREAIRTGGLHLDTQVARSLFERATGYDVVEKRVVVINGADVETVELHRHIPGNVQAQIHWLKKRNENWKDQDDVGRFEKDKETIAELLGISMEELPE